MKRRYRAADLVLAACLGGLLLWTALAGWRGDRPLEDTIAQGTPMLFLGAGTIAGRLSSRRELTAFTVAGAAALVVAVAVVFPFYSNAEAAVGVQLVALASLLLVGTAEVPGGARAENRTVLIAAVVGTGGVLLAARSQAASILVILIVVIIVVSLRSWITLSRRIFLRLGVGSVFAAALTVLFLGATPIWPWWLEQSESLSWARQLLWVDALSLWRGHPIFGAGPGSFFEYSETARSEDHLYAAHSSILQVGAERGSVGVLLLLGILVSGAYVAAQGERARALIGVAAWCALAVHSMIDHLYEFPLVTLLAGMVIGWAGARNVSSATPVPPPPRPRAERSRPTPA